LEQEAIMQGYLSENRICLKNDTYQLLRVIYSIDAISRYPEFGNHLAKWMPWE
jgi:hypothetical protein